MALLEAVGEPEDAAKLGTDADPGGSEAAAADCGACPSPSPSILFLFFFLFRTGSMAPSASARGRPAAELGAVVAVCEVPVHSGAGWGPHTTEPAAEEAEEEAER